MSASDFYVVFVGAAAGAVTLPTSTVGIEGRLYYIKNTTASFNVTVIPAGTETIDGAGSVMLLPGYTVLLVNTGLAGASATWEIIRFSAATSEAPLVTASDGLAANGDVKLGSTLTQYTILH